MLDLAKKNQDILYGGQKEQEVKERLENYFSCNLRHTNGLYGKFCPFDFEDGEKKIRIEIKSRRIKHNQYPTIFIGRNKLIEAKKYEECGGQHYICWNCLDGIYYTRYEDTLLDYPVKLVNLHRGEMCEVVDIPVNILKKVE